MMNDKNLPCDASQNLDKLKNLSFGKMLFKGAFIFNPILTQAIGICSVVAIATDIRTSLALSATLSLLLIVNEVLASLLFKKLSRWVRVALYMLTSTAILVPIMIYLDDKHSDIFASMGIYLGLLAVNSLIVIRCEKFSVKNKLRYALVDAVSASIGFSVVTIISAAIREYIAFGTLYSSPVSSFPKYLGLAMPFGGLIVLGFMSAFHKWIIQKKFRGQPTNTFNLRSALENPDFKEEGIKITRGSLSFVHDPEVLEESDDDNDFIDKIQEHNEKGGNL